MSNWTPYLIPGLSAQRRDDRAHEVDPEVEMGRFDEERAHALQRDFA